MRHLIVSYMSLLVLSQTSLAQESARSRESSSERVIRTEVIPYVVKTTQNQGRKRVAILFARKTGSKVDAIDFKSIELTEEKQLISAISGGFSAFQGKYRVLPLFPGLQDAFETTSLNPSDVDLNDVLDIQRALKVIHVDIGIIIRSKSSDSTDNNANKTINSIVFTVITTDSNKDFVSQAAPGDRRDTVVGHDNLSYILACPVSSCSRNRACRQARRRCRCK